jgi:hypothetical protein
VEAKQNDSIGSLGDAGTFTAFPSGVFFGGGDTHNGTFNSTPNPLPVASTILIKLTELHDAAFHLNGTRTSRIRHASVL